MVPPGSSAHGLSCSRQLSPLSGRNSTYRSVQISATGSIVDPGAYYFRTTPYFETSSEKYRWMNRICSIASGSLSANARTLDVFQVL
ncbi:DUF3237 family protein [Bradyrhizobium sp. Ash2021]|uniref:DUF3237 family protein n=1 Tax=Bradyrhizobium sp. Ash2021 TaxID=2954771 RepID=UPI0035C16742